MAVLQLLCALAFVGTGAVAGGLASSLEVDEHVVVVTDNNFHSVVSSHRTVLLEFYAPWCGHCKNLVPEYSAVARVLHQKQQQDGGDFNMVVAKCDATANRRTAMEHSVTGYPTITLFQNGELYEKYTGERNFEDILEYVRDMDESCGAENSESASGQQQQHQQQQKKQAAKKQQPTFRYAPADLVEDGFVIVPDDSSMELLESSDTPWLIASFKNGCGHCRRMEGDWNAGLRAAHASGAKLRVAVINAETMSRESPLLSILPGYRGTPGLFSYIPASIAAGGEAVAAQIITASRTKEMVEAVVQRIQAKFSADVSTPAEALSIAAESSLTVSHDLTFLLIANPENAQAGQQAQRFRTLASTKATGMMLYATGDVEAFTTHFGVTVNDQQSIVVAFDSRGKQVAGYINLLSSESLDDTFAAVADWIAFKTATAFQWMSPVNQGSYFEATKHLGEMNQLGWADVDKSKRITTAITVMVDGAPDDEYRAIIDEAQTLSPNSIIYFQDGGYLQRRFLYGLHCPDVANIPCINIHPIESPFVNVLRLSTLLNGPDADRYTQDKKSSLFNIISDFEQRRARRESFQVMDNIKVIGKIKSLALERGEDFNQRLNALEYPPFSAPIDGNEEEGRAYREGRPVQRSEAISVKQQQKPRPKPKSKARMPPASKTPGTGGKQSTKAKLLSKMKDLTKLMESLQKEILAMSDDDDWE